VARFFTKWKAAQQQNVATSQRNLQAQVTPDSNKVVKPPVGKRYFTRAEIAEFYSAARRGEIKAKDMVAMEAEIHSATVEGRIR
jgi:ribosomal protein L1